MAGAPAKRPRHFGGEKNIHCRANVGGKNTAVDGVDTDHKSPLNRLDELTALRLDPLVRYALLLILRFRS